MGSARKRADIFMRDKMGATMLWSISGPADTRIEYIEGWFISDRIVLVQIFDGGSFGICPALNILDTKHLAVALSRLGELE